MALVLALVVYRLMTLARRTDVINGTVGVTATIGLIMAGAFVFMPPRTSCRTGTARPSVPHKLAT